LSCFWLHFHYLVAVRTFPWRQFLTRKNLPVRRIVARKQKPLMWGASPCGAYRMTDPSCSSRKCPSAPTADRLTLSVKEPFASHETWALTRTPEAAVWIRGLSILFFRGPVGENPWPQGKLRGCRMRCSTSGGDTLGCGVVCRMWSSGRGDLWWTHAETF